MGLDALFALPGLLLIALLVAGLITGIALLATGLAKKRRGVWVSGLVVLACSGGIVIAAGIAGVLALLTTGRGRSVPPTAVVVAPPPASTTRTAVREAPSPTVADALGLPADAEVPASARILSSSVTYAPYGPKRRAVIAPGEDLQSVLKDYYEKVSWEQIAPLVTTPRFRHADPDWTASRLAGLACYRRTSPEGPESVRLTALCCDAQAGRVYCVWLRQPRPIDDDTHPPAGQ